MIVLHAGLADGKFLFWGETPPIASSSPKKGRRTKITFLQALPFNAGPELLLALRNIAAELTPAPGESDRGIIWVPTVEGQPVASTPVIAPAPQPGTTVLAPWSITTVAMPLHHAIDLLGQCQDQTVLAPGVVIGTTLAYWAAAARFAGTLIAQQQFLPSIETVNGSWRAGWRPALTPADRQRLGQLALAMPAACRAMTTTAETPPARPAVDVLTEFVTAVIDTLVRSTATQDSAAAPGTHRQTASHFESLHDQWLHALRVPAGVLHGPAGELEKLAEQVRTWQRPSGAAAPPFRLCFRLEEPPGEANGNSAARTGDWTVRYLLQAQDDPSLLIPVADAWNAKGRQAAVLQRGGFRPRKYPRPRWDRPPACAP